MTVAPTPIHERPTPHHNLRWMAAGVLLALVAVGVVLLVRHDVGGSSSSPGTIQGSGVAATQSRDVPAFTGVELAGTNDVTVHVGGKQSVVVRADDNLIGRVSTRVETGDLVIGTTGSFSTRSPMSVDVSVPSLAALKLSGSGIVAVDGVDSRSLTVTLSGSGVVRGSGAADRLTVGVSGSGDAALGQLTARDVHAVVRGSGRIDVTATKSLDASVPGSGAIFYGGDPMKVVTSVTGSGAVVRT